MSYSREFTARFWRYGRGCGFNGDISGPVTIHAANFSDAVSKAQLVLEGMRSVAIPDALAKDNPEYEVHSIVMAGTRVTPCEGRLNIWAASDLGEQGA